MSNYASLRGSSAVRQISNSPRPLPNPTRPGSTAPPGPGAKNPSGTPYAGMNNTRPGKFEGRSDRRWGDWSILELSLQTLWFDAACLAAADEGPGCAAEEIMMDLWP
jgi:hypothetical protein